MWQAQGQVVSVTETPYEIEGRKGITYRLTFVVQGHAPATVNLSPECISALGADYHTLKAFGTWVHVTAEFPDRLSDRGTMRPIKATSVELLDVKAASK